MDEVCLAGLEAEAAIAEVARASRSPGQLDRSRRTAGELLDRMRRVAGGRPPDGLAAAGRLTAEAQWSRVDGSGDPARWVEVAAAWDGLGFPFPAASARFRQAEALLAGGGSRAEAAAVAYRLRLTG